MKYVPHTPVAPPLAGVVEVMFSLEEYAPPHRIERIVPNGRMNLVIELDDRDRYIYDNRSGSVIQTCNSAWISGIHSNYLSIGDTTVESRLAVVQLAPGRSLPLLHQRLDRFVDRVTPAADVFGSETHDLRDELRELESAEAINGAMERWLISRYDAEREPPKIIRDVLSRLMEDPGEVAFTELVEDDGSVSYRHFLELFKEHVGPTPKLLQRILRFSRVFDRIQGKSCLDWADLSLELGYSDQAHFIRDFRAFSGYRPQRFLDEGHERLNFFPEGLVD